MYPVGQNSRQPVPDLQANQRSPDQHSVFGLYDFQKALTTITVTVTDTVADYTQEEADTVTGRREEAREDRKAGRC